MKYATKIDSCGWVGCLPTLPNDDLEIQKYRAQFKSLARSESMNKVSEFNEWVYECTMLSCKIILKMMNTIEAGQQPPRAKVVAKQIKQSQEYVLTTIKNK